MVERMDRRSDGLDLREDMNQFRLKLDIVYICVEEGED